MAEICHATWWKPNSHDGVVKSPPTANDLREKKETKIESTCSML